MNNLVSRKDVEMVQTNMKLELYYLLEKINILEDIAKKGREAEKELKELDIKLTELCKKIVEGVQDERD